MTPLTPEQVAAITSTLTPVLEHEPMDKHTNFRIGGAARLYYSAPDSEALVRAVQAAKQAGTPFYVFGGGSNLLVSDLGYEGLMIQAANRGLAIREQTLIAEAGVLTALTARKAAEAGLTGFEWAIGVPGTIGGAVYGNAGCFGGEMKDVVSAVDAVRLDTGERKRYANAECAFGYRDSMFKHVPHLILGCEIMLAIGEKATALAKLNDINSSRKASQPLAQASAGCLFKNFEFSSDDDIAKLIGQVDVPKDMLERHRISAGWLVDQIGLLGKTMGKVKVSEEHGNFIVNTGGGKAEDVIALASLVKMKIRDEYGVMLQDEVQLVGFG
jgi:UDP-N-acetylmuramate dehydrogenase